MRTTALLLAAVVAALLFAESFSAPTPCSDGATVIKASKKEQASARKCASADSSIDEIQTNTPSGSLKAKSSKSHSTSSTNSATQTFESLEISNGGASTCGDTLPARKCGESDVEYYKRIFPVKECDKNSWSAFYKIVFKIYTGESKKDFVKRIDIIFTECYPNMDCRTNIVYKEYIREYILIKYAQLKGETEEAYFQRTITKCGETEAQYKSKVDVLRLYITGVKWTRIKIDTTSKTGFKIINEKETSTSTGKSVDDSSCKCKKTITEEEVKKTYAQKSGESNEEYYKRIVTKSGDTDEYILRISILRKMYPTLTVWYDIKWIKEYYTIFYAKKCSETVQSYYKRIVAKESYETDEQWAKRVETLMSVFPSSEVWSKEEYYEIIKNIYSIIYKQGPKEETTTYYNRIFTKIVGESEMAYSGRITLIKYTCSSLGVWYDLKYLYLTKEFYTLKYKKLAGETDEKYYLRIVTKEKFETDEQSAQRIECVHWCYPNDKLFWDVTYYEKYMKIPYSAIYKKSCKEAEKDYYERITRQMETETDSTYCSRMAILYKMHRKLSLWSFKKYYNLIQKFYEWKYAKGTKECEDTYYKRLVAKEESETDEVYWSRVYLIHLCTIKESLWTEEKYYKKYTETYYINYFKKGEKETCPAWLTRVTKLMPKETLSNAIKRIKMINKSKTGCSCWTKDNLNKLKCNKTITEEYYNLLCKAFITSTTLIKRSASHTQSGSTTNSASTSNTEVSIKNCN